MKRWLKIPFAIIAAIVALIVAALALLQIPQVQKKLCDKATDIISEKTGMDLSVGDIHFALFDRFILDDVALASEGDTLLVCNKASLSFSPLSLLGGELAIKRLSLDGGEIYPSRFPSPAEKDAEADSTKGFSLPKLKASIGHLKLNDFKVVNYNEGGPFVNRARDPRMVDFNDMRLTDIDVDIKNVKFDGKSASADVEGISFKEDNSGMELKNLSFDADYDSTGIHISDFNIKDNYSDISIPEANLKFDDFSDFSHFQDSVSFDAEIQDSFLDLQTIQRFAENTSSLELKLFVDGSVGGNIKDIRTESLKVWSGTKESFLDLSAHLVGLPDALHTMASIEVKDSYTNTKDIAEIAYQCTAFKDKFDKSSISKLAPGTKLSFVGSLNGFFEDFVAFGAVKSDLGGCNVDLMCRTNGTTAYEVLGYADLNDFDLGRFLQVDGMGKATCHASASGFFANKPENTEYYIDELTIPKFEFNDYTYSNISASGNWKQNEFEARVVSADPNLKFMLQGIMAPSSSSGNSLYHLQLSLGHADLAALNFDKRDLSTVRLNAKADITKNSDGRIMGKVNVSDIECKSPDGAFYPDDIELVSFNGDKRYMMSIKSDMLSARYRGSAFVTDIIPQVEAAVLNGKLDNLAQRMKKAPKAGNDKFELKVKAHDLRQLLGYLAPGIHIENGTAISIKSPGDTTCSATIQSPLLALNNIYVQDLNSDIDFGKTAAKADFTTQMIRVGGMTLSEGKVNAKIADNSILANVGFCNDPDSLEAGHLQAMVSFPNLKESSQKMLVHMGHSFINMGGEQWKIDPSSIYFADKRISVNDFSLYNDIQGLNINGVLSDRNSDTCSFNIRELDLSLANLLMKNPLNISGTMSGSGKVISIFSKPDVFADVAVDSLYLAGQRIGRIEAISQWDDTLHRMNLLARNILDGKEVLRAGGYYDPTGDKVNATVSAKDFGLGIVEPFISTLATDVSGTLSADVAVTGPLNALDITMKEGRLNQFRAKLDYTKVPYTMDGFIDMIGPKITLRDFKIKDDEHGTGTLVGQITHNHFKDFNLDIRIKAHDLMGINTSIKENETFYGKAYANGSVNITGPVNALALNLDIATRPGSIVNIPIKSASSSSSSIITFVDNKPRPKLSSIDSLINLSRAKVITEETTASGGLSVFARVHATEDARLNLEIDSNTGDALHVRGDGTVDITVKDNSFSIYGDYTVSEGDYSLALLGLVTRDFSLNPGSAIHFTGDIMQSELDMTAAYKTKASISPLVSSSGETSLRRPVNCSVLISGKLSNPTLGFNIDIDDLDPTVEATIASTLNTDEKRMRQFLALLISGSFIPDEQSGIVNNTSVSYFNATEIMSNQLNSILQQLGIPIDFGFNYQPTDTGQDIFDVAVSTQLMNNRVTVNGNIGNRRYMTSNRDDIVGDLDVDIKLDRRGKTKLKLFSHSADEYSNYLDQTQRNGVGISYQQEFNNFKDLFRRKNRKNKEGDTDAVSPPPADSEQKPKP